MEHLHNESSSIEAAATENFRDPKGHGVLPDKLEATELFLQKQICVKTLRALRSFLVQVDWNTSPVHLDENDRAQDFDTKTKTENACEGMLTSLLTACAKESHHMRDFAKPCSSILARKWALVMLSRNSTVLAMQY